MKDSATIPLRVPSTWSDECRDHGTTVPKGAFHMTTFTIDTHNNITAHASAADIPEDTERFSSIAELTEWAAQWPTQRLVEIWNRLPGVTPVNKFKDRAT